jgi:folate-binding protein YgfZ
MLTSPGQQQNVIDFLDKYTIMEDLEVEDITDKTSMLRLTGPSAADLLARVSEEGILVVDPPADPNNPERPPSRCLLADDPGDAARIVADLVAAGAVRISADTAEALRIAQARPAHGAELSDTYNPLEAGLIGAIDFHKGCYIGQEVIARLDTYHKVQKYLVSLAFDAEQSQAGALPGSGLVNDEGAAMGLITSATVVPGGDGARIIGLGYVRTAAVQVGGTLQVASDDGNMSITARITAQPLLFGPEKPGPGR